MEYLGVILVNITFSFLLWQTRCRMCTYVTLHRRILRMDVLETWNTPFVFVSLLSSVLYPFFNLFFISITIGIS
jgi:hypothetical protein